MPSSCGAMAEAFAGGQHRSRALATSHYDVKCAEGFRCMSKVAEFGLGHDGAFGKREAARLDPRLNGAYEWGCPARGAMTAAGACQDTGKGASSLCYSNVRFEAGPGTPCDTPDKCLCAKANTPSGSKGHGHRHAESVNGLEVVSGSFSVLPMAKCRECGQHDCDRRQCNECQGCEYTTKKIAGRTTTGCFDLDGGRARQQREEGSDGRVYLTGDRAVDQGLTMVPHYDFWDPNAGQGSLLTDASREPQMPYEGGYREPLSRSAWRDAYKQAAPQIQHLMDQLVKQVKEVWAPLSGEEALAPNAQHLDCFDLKTQGDDVAGKLEKVLFVQRACKQMQGVARSIANGAPFSNVSDSGAPVNCAKMEGGGGDCGSLNCYAADEDFGHALRALAARNKQCRLAREYLEDEEERFGPAPPDSTERSKAGRVEPLPGKGQATQGAGPPSGSAAARQSSAAALCLLPSASAGPCGRRPRRCRRAALREFLSACA